MKTEVAIKGASRITRETALVSSYTKMGLIIRAFSEMEFCAVKGPYILHQIGQLI